MVKTVLALLIFLKHKDEKKKKIILKNKMKSIIHQLKVQIWI